MLRVQPPSADALDQIFTEPCRIRNRLVALQRSAASRDVVVSVDGRRHGSPMWLSVMMSLRGTALMAESRRRRFVDSLPIQTFPVVVVVVVDDVVFEVSWRLLDDRRGHVIVVVRIVSHLRT